MNKEQPTPEILSTQEENELICERLLGWTPCKHLECVGWFHHDGRPCVCGPSQEPHPRTRFAHSFTTWADAGLILEAMGRNHHIDFGKNSHGNGQWFCAFEDTSNTPVGEDYAETGPLAIRAAALEYIRSLP